MPSLPDHASPVSTATYAQRAISAGAAARSYRVLGRTGLTVSALGFGCIHPEFLADQLTRSLDRLGLTRLDVYLLHNPEYFLLHAHKHGGAPAPAAALDEFYRRVRYAFAQLENEVTAGRLNWYGVSSNTFANPADVRRRRRRRACSTWRASSPVNGRAIPIRITLRFSSCR